MALIFINRVGRQNKKQTEKSVCLKLKLNKSEEIRDMIIGLRMLDIAPNSVVLVACVVAAFIKITSTYGRNLFEIFLEEAIGDIKFQAPIPVFRVRLNGEHLPVVKQTGSSVTSVPQT